MDIDEAQLSYLKLLSAEFPSIRAASTEIVDLNAELNLPKGTEHFISDIHGEYEAFRHVLKNGSGSIKRKIEENFATLPAGEKRALATLIYYPGEKLPLILQTVADEDDWYRTTISCLGERERYVLASTAAETMYYLWELEYQQQMLTPSN
jgi:fructose-1,6-bisphosphatase-3